MTRDLTSSTTLTPQLDGPDARQAGRGARVGGESDVVVMWLACGCHQHVVPPYIPSSLPSSSMVNFLLHC